MADDMAIVCCVVIAIAEENYPVTENAPTQQQPQQGKENQGGEVRKSEGIICPQKANNVQNYFSCFRNYTQEEVLNMSKLELFLFFFPFGYLNTTLIPKIIKVLNDPLDLGESMKCVGCWLYMDCWVGITDRRDWWPVTMPVMHRGAPFWLNQYMSRHRFGELFFLL